MADAMSRRGDGLIVTAMAIPGWMGRGLLLLLLLFWMGLFVDLSAA
jgi:hypothetical protein